MNVVVASFVMAVQIVADAIEVFMEWYWIVLICLASVFVLATGTFSFMMVYQMTRGKRVTLQDHYDYCQKFGFQFEFPNMSIEPLNFTMSDGYVLTGEYNAVPNAKGIVICCHGHMALRESSRKYADFFNEIGYSAIIYDHRGHGDNVRTFVSMGYRESRDLSEVIRIVRNQFGNDIKLGIHGESMGGAIVLMSLAYQPNVDFVIDDCGYASLKHEMKWLSESRFHLPFFLCAGFLEIALRISCGFGLSDVRPMNAIKESNVPILFIHGTADTYVNPRDSKLMYDLYQGPKKLVLVEGACHAISIYKDRDLYRNSVEEFLKETLL